jgi:hypothetical protein
MPMAKFGYPEVLGCLLISLMVAWPTLRSIADVPEAGTVTVAMTRSPAVKRFNPVRDLGACIDMVEAGKVDKIYTPDNIAQMLSAGYGPISYRLGTELQVQAWHWADDGTWSETTPEGPAGYFTGNARTRIKSDVSYGYRLPRRGFTHDEGDDSGYSRLTDDPGNHDKTYWKSNPYLAQPFTGDPDEEHPQWALLDLGRLQPVDTIHISWAQPYAQDYQVQYWSDPPGSGDPLHDPLHGQWVTFPTGLVTDSPGGEADLRLTDVSLNVRFVRIVMTRSSGTSLDPASRDVRDRCGYAIYEIGLGRMEGGQFQDLVVHTPGHGQTPTTVSSVDPWHRPSDMVTGEEQPGFDFAFRTPALGATPLTRNLPVMVPVAVLYGTPDDAAAEIAYLKNRRFPLGYVEMGEEADQQFIEPEDYGALYVQWARAMHRVAPSLKIGGPVFASPDGVNTWPEGTKSRDWFARFVNYLDAHHALEALSFISTEYYPDDRLNADDWGTLLSLPSDVRNLLDLMHGPPQIRTLPVFVTEYNASWRNTEPNVIGACWHADFLGSWLTAGGRGAYFYEYEPLPLAGKQPNDPQSYGGTFSIFTVAEDSTALHIRQRLPQFYSSRMVTQEWAQPVDAAQEIYPVTCNIRDGNGPLHVTAYALHRPDGQWALLLINKDPHPHAVTVHFQDTAVHTFVGPVTAISYGEAQYQWHRSTETADPDLPEARQQVTGGSGMVYHLPGHAITVLRGRVR